MEEVILFVSIPLELWKPNFLQEGIRPKDLEHKAGDKTVILVSSVPFVDSMEENIEVMFKKSSRFIFRDPDVDDEEVKDEGNYWGHYVMYINPDEIIKTLPSGFLEAHSDKYDITGELPFVGADFIKAKALPPEQRIWTPDCKLNINLGRK